MIAAISVVQVTDKIVVILFQFSRMKLKQFKALQAWPALASFKTVVLVVYAEVPWGELSFHIHHLRLVGRAETKYL